jgi:hypothetical protein
VFQIIQCLLESGRHQKPAAGGQLADEEFENGRLLHALVEISLKHGELIEVGHERA